MKKILKHIICFTLAISTFLSIVSCKNTDDSANSNRPVIDVGGNTGVESGPTTHIIDVKDSQTPFFRNAQTEYTIVYAGDTYEKENVTAIAEMKTLIYQSTSYKMEAKSDTAERRQNKIISVGLTEQAKSQSEIIAKYNSTDFNGDGYMIETVGDSVYILGKTSRGNLYGVYEFLEHQFDFDTISDDIYLLKENVIDMNLKEFHVLDIPDFMYRTPQLNLCDTQFRNRIRVTDNTSMFNNVEGNSFAHNVFEVVPKATYMESHPNWYSADGEQLCLSARGNEEEADLLATTFAEELIRRLEIDPKTDFVSFSPEDGGTHCNCPGCTKEYPLYGNDNTGAFAQLIVFSNKIAKIIKEWNQANCPEREIRLFVYHYGKTLNPPVKMDANKKPIADENGNYLPYTHEKYGDLILDDNIAVIYCGFRRSFYGFDQEKNEDYFEQLKRLETVMTNKQFYFWIYSACFKNYMIPHYTLASRQSHYQGLKAIGGDVLYDQAQYDNGATTGFGTMNYYVTAKLAWDVNADVAALQTKFMKNYFQEAYEPMNNLWVNYSAYMSYLAAEYGAISNHNNSTNFTATKYWPLSKIDEFLGYIEEAYASIAPLKNTEPERYEMLYKHILRESIQFRYLRIKLYLSYYDFEILNEKKKEFINDCRLVGITKAAEHIAIDDVWSLI